MRKVVLKFVVSMLLTSSIAYAGNGDFSIDGTFTVGAGGIKYSNGTGTYIKISDVKPSGTCAQTGIVSAWNTRQLNTIDTDASAFAILTSNQITLSPGTYLAQITAPFYAAGMGAARLQNVTNGTTLLNGTNVYGGGGIAVMTYSFIRGTFTVTASQKIEIQQYFTGGAACGGGPAMGIPGRNEVYTVVELWKLQ